MHVLLPWLVIPLVAGQPLPGGGGGGGGGGGSGGGGYSGSGSSSSDDHDDRCISNCKRCSDSWSCDVCDSGYRLTSSRTCEKCPRHCEDCDYSGPERCDRCYARYVLVRGWCKSCAPHCLNCDKAGADSCDVCDDGYMLDYGGGGYRSDYSGRRARDYGDDDYTSDFGGRRRREDYSDDDYMSEDYSGRRRRYYSDDDYMPDYSGRRTCLACTTNCRRCRDTSPTGCTECYSMYRLQGDGSCAVNKLLATVLATVAGMIGALIYYAHGISNGRDWPGSPGRPLFGGGGGGGRSGPPRQRPADQREYVGAGDWGRPRLPSGVWRGYYTFAGTRHDVCEFSLYFNGGTGDVKGEGTDDVGEYIIKGLHSQQRLAFSKTYVPRSRNVSGVVSYGNKGHTVEYRGELAGGSLGSGFRGGWSIRSSVGDHDGQFHLWPAMEGWSDQAPSREEAGGAGAGGGRTFEESECVVCYDRPIGTRLVPCGHVALCAECAGRLNPRKCPLCRVDITAVNSHTPTAGGS